MRVVALWFPDWPARAAILAAGLAPRTPVAVIKHNKVVACTAEARAAGVRRGMRRRHAQAACPELTLCDADPERSAQEFEPVVQAMGDVAASIEIMRPGLAVIDGGGPTNYHGSEDTALEMLLDAAALAGVDCHIGVADELVTAVLAARRAQLVPPGQSAQFLAQLPIADLAAEAALGCPADFVESLRQLGVRRVADFVALPRRDVASRFGDVGLRWHQLAAGEGERRVSPSEVATALAVSRRLDEPLLSTDEAAFLGRQLAIELHEALRGSGLACLRLAVRAEFSDGTEVQRVWRCTEPLREQDTADRVRWQLDGWLSARSIAQGAVTDASGVAGASGVGGASGADHDAAADFDVDAADGIIRLTIDPVETAPAGSVRPGLWGRTDEAEERAQRVLVRVQSLLGPEAVRRPIRAGGRSLSEQIRLVPVGEEPDNIPDPDAEWAGALPAPLPAVLNLTSGPSRAHPAAQTTVLDAGGNPVHVTGRALLSAEPATFNWGQHQWEITGWAGPWPVDERWWANNRRYARMQVAVDTATGPQAFILLCYRGKWRIEAAYR
ncbi:DNA polymerase Y family protein [Corynebacterium ulceribovis]|uniref:DNA polymerase Y family protein n=1 Tax=Corynebacterium ulceribovis TaxID=487732 RepID=UPI0003A56D11|nr:DNA polymerase Y family protein [Corynebacterium ulceribovis]